MLFMSFLSLDTSHIAVITLTGFAVALVAFIALTAWIVVLQRRINRMLGGNAHTIEAGLEQIQKRLAEAEKFQRESTKYLRAIEVRVKRSLQTSDTVRFNPFKGTGAGGNQSFATAFVNENGDGVVLSSLYSRERVSVFSKPVKEFTPVYELSEEEASVVRQAEAALKQKPQEM